MSRWGAEISVLTEELAESDRFWRTYGVDKEHGGFMCSLGHDGELLAPNKFICETTHALATYSLYHCTHHARH